MLDERGEYFDVRTGNTWDLFFPGYYRTPEDQRFEHQTGARRVGHDFAAQWFFNPRDFDRFRREVETKSGKRWTYSGGTDLVLINAWIPEAGEPTIDWVSTIAGQLDDDSAGATDVSLANVVERITRDLEDDREDPAYGVGDVTDGPSQPPRSTAAQDLMINALGGIAAALGVKALGG